MRKTKLLLITVSFLLLTFCHGIANAYQTKKVVVIVLCGVRSSEAMLDPDHQYIPNIWNNLRPLGVVNTGVQTFIDPTTFPGHYSILTGTGSKLFTTNFNNDRYRTQEPTFFEYFRKGLNLTKEDVFAFIGGEYLLQREDYSLHPLFGDRFKASLVRGSERTFDDYAVQQQIYSMMDTYNPSVIFATLKKADIEAHRSNWNGYLDAIMAQDQIIYEIWNKIEGDAGYAGKTTLFVIGDHGRHDDANGGYTTHGKIMSDGDRIVPFLAIGPDFKSDLVIDKPRKLTDLAPTIGELLGFRTPFADGRVMWEIFKSPAVYDKKGKNKETYPSLVINNNQRHVVYQKTPLLISEGNEEVYYYNMDSGGKGAAMRLNGDYLLSLDPSIAGSTSGLHMVYSGWLATDGTYQNQDDWQHIYYRRSTDNGVSWSSPVQLSGSWPRFKERAWIDAEGENVAVVFAMESRFIVTRVSTDGGLTWESESSIDAVSARSASLAIEGSDIHVVYHDFEELSGSGGNRDIYYIRSNDLGRTWSSFRLTTDTANDLNADIAVTGSTIYMVWESDKNNIWQVYYSKSTDAGSTWSSAVKLSSSTVGAQKPKVEVSGDKVVVTWVDYADNKGSIYSKRSPNGGVNWTVESRLMATSGQVRNMQLAKDGGNFFVVWEENRNGEWEVFVSERF